MFHANPLLRFGLFLPCWDSLGFSGGPPPIISPILGQFWPFLTTFGPFSDCFWAVKKIWLFLPENGILAEVV